MAHTPGPWHTFDRLVQGPGGAPVAAVHGPHVWDNVRLIAAAPELLAALKLLRDPDGDGEWVCYCDDPHYEGGKCENCVATAAIDKAEGRSE